MGESWKITRLSGSLGAEVGGIALGTVGPAEAKEVLSLLLEHQVLFFSRTASKRRRARCFRAPFWRTCRASEFEEPFFESSRDI